ncbi:MAG TPA: hypothetical protein P5346_14090 [Spirochaetota bacterium]|nr:hypothetical protein [Spirochaetota bacterium]
MRKSLFIILALLAFTAAIAPPGWKVYKDKKGRFEVSLPCEPMESTPDHGPEITDNLKLECTFEQYYYRVELIEYGEAPTESAFDGFTRQIVNISLEPNEEITSATKRQSRGLPFWDYTINRKPNMGNIRKERFTAKDKLLFRISSTPINSSAQDWTPFITTSLTIK